MSPLRFIRGDFFRRKYMSLENDLLLTAAKKYESLLESQLIILVGRKGKSENIFIDFKAFNFYHLAGLHKLRDIQALRGYNTSCILKRILLMK